ncbi:MAG: glycoside hydrolase family 127 protein [Candidatus Sumerlaeia bacterium]|nr:glycoside hydrolase family 127 protein [Candidatus Sumerlaeia bacterium]
MIPLYRSYGLTAALVLPLLLSGGVLRAENRHYVVNREPLAQSAFVPLPLGSVKPRGWLRDQLVIQAHGLTGHLDEFWPSLAKSEWRGIEGGEAWERGPYYLDGLLPLAYVLDDPRLKDKVRPWMEWMLSSGQPNGWFGPAKNKDRWPLAVAMKVLTQYYEATGDERALSILKNYFRYLLDNPPDWPDKDWRGVRAGENVVSAFWLYNRTGDRNIIKVADSIRKNSFRWVDYFLNFPFPAEVLEKGYKPAHPSHVVNISMAIKYPGLCYMQCHEDPHKEAVYKAFENLDKHHGQVAGRFAGDEHLSGRKPTQGTELCGVVEYMFSLENLIGMFGDPAFSDRLEMLAYNALPGTCTPDFWAHQYDQQANQVLCTVAKRNWRTNGPQSNIYGLEPNYGCCTANMHQGWPKLVAHLWMATHDQGLAAVAYGPSEVKAKVADGAEVTIIEETDYPFAGTLRFLVFARKPAKFPLHLRIPTWAEGATVKIGGQTQDCAAGTYVKLDREWKSGDVIELILPMRLRVETRWNDAAAIYRGPLVFSLKIGERFEKIKSYHETLPVADWEVFPTTPWNYGLILDRENPEKSLAVEQRKVGKVPFANDAPPVVLRAKGRQIPEWTLVDNSAGDTPKSPAVSNEPTVDLELIPYGNTRLRITEFPVIAAR